MWRLSRPLLRGCVNIKHLRKYGSKVSSNRKIIRIQISGLDGKEGMKVVEQTIKSQPPANPTPLRAKEVKVEPKNVHEAKVGTSNIALSSKQTASKPVPPPAKSAAAKPVPPPAKTAATKPAPPPAKTAPATSKLPPPQAKPTPPSAKTMQQGTSTSMPLQAKSASQAVKPPAKTTSTRPKSVPAKAPSSAKTASPTVKPTPSKTKIVQAAKSAPPIAKQASPQSKTAPSRGTSAPTQSKASVKKVPAAQTTKVTSAKAKTTPQKPKPVSQTTKSASPTSKDSNDKKIINANLTSSKPQPKVSGIKKNGKWLQIDIQLDGLKKMGKKTLPPGSSQPPAIPPGGGPPPPGGNQMLKFMTLFGVGGLAAAGAYLYNDPDARKRLSALMGISDGSSDDMGTGCENDKAKKEKDLIFAAENEALECILGIMSEEALDSVNKAIPAQNEAVNAMKNHSMLLKKAMDNTGESEGTDGDWRDVTAARLKVQDTTKIADHLAESAKVKLSDLKEAIQEGRENKLTKGNSHIPEAESNLKQMRRDLNTAVIDRNRAQFCL